MFGVSKRRRWFMALAVAACSVLAATGRAQSTFATISGVVEDSSGAVLPGVTVTAQNEQTGLQRSVVTGERGAYRISELPPGRYGLKVDLTGFTQQERTGLALALGAQVTMSFKLELSSVQEAVTVTAAAPLVDTTSAALGTSISPQEVDDLPITGRKFIELALLAPGAAPNVSEGSTQSDSISFGGFGEAFKSLWLEGVDINDEVTGGGSAISNAARHTFSQESVEEFQIIANQYSVEFGRSATGVINILTKSGTNNPTGRAYYFLRDDAFDKPNYFARGEVPFRQQQFGGTYGGPIKKDRIHWFGTYERQSADEVATVDVPAFLLPILPDPRSEVPRITRTHNLFNKFTAALKPGQFLSLISMWGKQDSDNLDVGANVAGDGGDNERAYDVFTSVGLTSVISNNLTNQLRVAHSTYVKDRLPSGALSPRVEFPSFQYGQANNYPQDRDQSNIIISSTMNFHKETARFGTHDFKWGAEGNWTRGRNAINSIFNGNFLFTADRLPVPGDPSTYPVRYQVRTGDTDLDRPIDLYAGFVEDNWRVKGGLTVALGLRYDLELLGGDFNGEVVPTDIPYTEFVRRFVAGDLRGKTYRAAPRDYNNLGPRLGIAWDPQDNGKMVFRLGAGLFYDAISSTTYGGQIRLYPGGRTQTFANDVRVTGVPNLTFPNPPALSTLVSQGSGNVAVPNASSQSPVVQQFSIGAQRQVFQRTALAVDYIRMHGLNFQRTINLNARLPNGQYPLFADGLTVGLNDYGNRLVSDQVQFKADQRVGTALTMRGSYTYAKVYTFNSPAIDKNNLDADWGPAANDVRHRFVMSTVARLPWGVQFGGIVTASSAAPYNITTGLDGNGDRDINERPLDASGVMTAPFSGRGDGFFRTDLRLSKSIGLGGERKLEVLWEMFNLFNTVNFGNYDGNMRSTRFAQPRFAAAPFQGQLGVRLDF